MFSAPFLVFFFSAPYLVVLHSQHHFFFLSTIFFQHSVFIFISSLHSWDRDFVFQTEAKPSSSLYWRLFKVRVGGLWFQIFNFILLNVSIMWVPLKWIVATENGKPHTSCLNINKKNPIPTINRARHTHTQTHTLSRFPPHAVKHQFCSVK